MALPASFPCNSVKELSSDRYALVLVISHTPNFLQTLRAHGYDPFELPSALLLEYPYYEIFVATHSVEKLSIEYDVDVNYDPLRVDGRMMQRLGVREANIHVWKRFWTRVVDQPQPVQRLYMAFLENCKPAEYSCCAQFFIC
ncbi:hypothetical protein W97_03233 [Coniosporium apollinis CBS 100218]|uniref:Uncharacterized protein n=1 Tax=Coniosporium apollinis (strain CBS 100218) TaxID=1168221 RepID=R7YQ80_CONA1|nr:uncharacterized protein W97_03233 [Coniosporium apollinis CBS 100218]EON64003.1 hypothetical protein W97_03233 [Coniosporium apollinis CBS 100218]